jgi:hypothetical protein
MSTTSIGILATAGLILLLFFLLRQRKNSTLFNRYCEAMQAENNGEAERAIRLYQEALHQNRKTKIRDKQLMGDMERRLKTLLISTDFEKSFRTKEMAAV